MFSIESLLRISEHSISRCIFLILMSSLYSPHAQGDHQVICPSQAILARVGENVTLPCYIEPSHDAEKMTVDDKMTVVEWSRADLQPKYVHVRQQGREVSHSKLNALYQQRTSLFPEEVPRGNISLKLSGVRLSDEGTFKCFVPTLGSSSTIQLRVGVVSQPVILTNDDNSMLTCDSGCWYPQPEVSWHDSGGNLLDAEPSSVTFAGNPSKCYTVQRNMMVRGAGRMTCRVHLPHINHTIETHRFITDHNFTPPTVNAYSTQLSSDGVGVIGKVVLGIVLGVMVFSVLAACIMVHWSYFRKKASNQSEVRSGALETEPMLKLPPNPIGDATPV